MAGLLDLILGGGAGLLGNAGAYAGPGSMNFGAGDPGNLPPQVASSPLAAMAQAQPQAQAAMAPAPAMPQGAPAAQAPAMQAPMDGGIGMGGGIKSGLFNMLAAMNPTAANAMIQRQMMVSALQSLPANMPMAQKMAVLQNPKVQEAMFGAPTNMGTMKLPNGAELPAYSIHGQAPTYNIPQNPALAGQLNTPAKLGESKVGEISGPVLYQNGAVSTALPGMGQPAQAQPVQPGQPAQPGQAGGLQGAIDLNNQITQQKAAAEAVGKAQGTNAATLPATTDTMDQFLHNIDTVRADPGLSDVIGPIAGRLPAIGGKSADLVNRISQLQSETALQGFQSLRGAGRITQAEMFKAGDALGRLNRVSSVDGFKSALNDLHDIVTSARTRAGTMAGTGPTPPQPSQGANAAPSFSQDQLREEAIRRGLIKGGLGKQSDAGTFQVAGDVVPFRGVQSPSMQGTPRPLPIRSQQSLQRALQNADSDEELQSIINRLKSRGYDTSGIG